MGTMIKILLIRLIALLATVVGFLYAYKKPRCYHFVFLIALFLACPYIAFKIYERDFMLSFIPDALKVETLVYEKDKTWGFGPGGDEAGIRVYSLPDAIAQQISKRGLEFFAQMPVNHDQHKRNWRGQYNDWSKTPIETDSRMLLNQKKLSFDIKDYLCTYDFCNDIQATLLEETNKIVNSPGSFYAYGRIGIIVVSPNTKQVLYFFSG